MNFVLWSLALDAIVSPVDVALDLLGPLFPAILIVAVAAVTAVVIRKRGKK